MKFLTLLASLVLSASAAHAQTDTLELRAGTVAERQMTIDETHSFPVNLEQGKVLDLVVDQRGIDVVVTVFAPDGKSLGAFDSPNGVNGPEAVSVIADADGKHRVEITAFSRQDGGATSGRYEIRVVGIRTAIDEEARRHRARQASPAKALALIDEAAADGRTLKLAANRALISARAADLMWNQDEDRARSLFREAFASASEKSGDATTVSPYGHHGGYDASAELKQQILQMIARRDPQLAIELLPDDADSMRHARTMREMGGDPSHMELTLALAVAAKNPQKAVEIAERSLTKGVSYRVSELLTRLSAKDPEAAAKLASAVAKKLTSGDFKDDQTRGMATTLLTLATADQPPISIASPASSGAKAKRTPLLSEQAIRDLTEAVAASALSEISGPDAFTELQSLMPVIEKYAPTRAAPLRRRVTTITQKIEELERLSGGGGRQQMSGNMSGVRVGTTEEMLLAAAKTSPEMQPYAYSQAVQRALADKDFARARKIVSDNVSDPAFRSELNAQIDSQAAEAALLEGRIADARRLLPQMRTDEERAMMLARLGIKAAGDGDKTLARGLIDEARTFVDGQATNTARLGTQVWVAQAYMLVEPERGFEMIETVVERFNELASAAALLDGFLQQGRSFEDGEMILTSGVAINSLFRPFEEALSSLARSDFDRARAAVRLIQRPEVRAAANLRIAEGILVPQGATPVDGGDMY